ncbi:MAG: hypothetical protein ACREWI_10195 [Telluria sp.]
MKLSDVKRLADELLDQGVPADTPLCIWNGEDEEVQELCAHGVLAAGPYRHDPSPKLGGNALSKRGPYFLIEATTQDVPAHARQINK